MNKNRKDLGKIGEDIAFNFIKKKGYKIIERNYFRRFSSGFEIGEIDIIAQPKKGWLSSLFRRKQTIHFIEVKTGFHSGPFSPEKRVNNRKRNKIAKMAETWLNEHHISLDSKWQIDVISVILDKKGNTKEIKFFQEI